MVLICDDGDVSALAKARHSACEEVAHVFQSSYPRVSCDTTDNGADLVGQVGVCRAVGDQVGRGAGEVPPAELVGEKSLERVRDR